MTDPRILSLYLVTDRNLALGRRLEDVVGEAVRGGVTMVQLREKSCSSREFLELALSLKACLAATGVPLIIDDRVDIALACDADGVHVGQHDLPYDAVRRILGPDKIVGLSVESLDDAVRANDMDVDYIGISPVYSTPTKTDTAPALGLDGVRAISAVSVHPSVGIGGINAGNVREIIRAGADGVAVVSAIMSAEDPYAAASVLRSLISEEKGHGME